MAVRELPVLRGPQTSLGVIQTCNFQASHLGLEDTGAPYAMCRAYSAVLSHCLPISCVEVPRGSPKS